MNGWKLAFGMLLAVGMVLLARAEQGSRDGDPDGAALHAADGPEVGGAPVPAPVDEDVAGKDRELIDAGPFVGPVPDLVDMPPVSPALGEDECAPVELAESCYEANQSPDDPPWLDCNNNGIRDDCETQTPAIVFCDGFNSDEVNAANWPVTTGDFGRWPWGGGRLWVRDYPDVDTYLESREIDLAGAAWATLAARIVTGFEGGWLDIEYWNGASWNVLRREPAFGAEDWDQWLDREYDLPRDALRPDFRLRLRPVSADRSIMAWEIDRVAVTRRESDCDGNGVLDSCDVVSGTMQDCNGNFAPDECDFHRFQLGRRVDYDVGTWPQSLATGDFDLDGDIDIVVGRGPFWCCDSTVRTMTNIGHGRFEIGPAAPAFSWPRSMASGDLNDDGRPDFVVASGWGIVFPGLHPYFWFLYLLGFPPCGYHCIGIPIMLEVQDRAQGVALGDVDGDSDLDVAVCFGEVFSTAGQATVFLNEGNNVFAQGPSAQVGETPRSVALADLNLDGYPDMVVANQWSETLTLALNNGADGSGTWLGLAAPETLDSLIDEHAPGRVERTEPFFVKAGDFNNDDRTDIVVATAAERELNDSWMWSITFLINAGSDEAGLWRGFQPPIESVVGAVPLAVEVGELNGDGYMDVIVANAEGESISVLLNKGFGVGGEWLGFHDALEYPVGTRPFWVSADDFNGDGRLDVAVANRATGNFGEPRGEPSVTVYLQIPTWTTDCNGNSVADDCEIAQGLLEDCDGDGQADICEPDCNANGVPDDCDLLGGAGTDCDDDGVLDECQIAADATVDCNGNRVLDACEVSRTYRARSLVLTPFRAAVPQSFTLPRPVPAESDVTIKSWAWGDVWRSWNEIYADVFINGVDVGRVFEDPPYRCNVRVGEYEGALVVPRWAFNEAIAGGEAEITLTTSMTDGCTYTDTSDWQQRRADPYIRVAVEYQTSGLPDQDQDGVPDSCQRPDLDIRPGACPSPLNPQSRGVVPVAVVGKPLFDVSQIDVDSLRLGRPDGKGTEVAPARGPRSQRAHIEDVSTPSEGDPGACGDSGGDGIDDLVVKFVTAELVEVLELDADGEKNQPMLTLRGSLLDGTPFEAADCIRPVGRAAAEEHRPPTSRR